MLVSKKCLTWLACQVLCRCHRKRIAQSLFATTTLILLVLGCALPSFRGLRDDVKSISFDEADSVKPLRVAVVNVDNRDLSSDIETAGYWTLSAVINANYAAIMGYDYLYLQLLPISDASKINQALTDGRNICNYSTALLMGEASLGPRPADVEAALQKSGEGFKEVVQAVHIGREAYRAASWAKLVALWSVSTEYDIIFFMDSDAFVVRDVPFEQAFMDAPLVYGHDAQKASFVMMGNRPFWREDMPCAGLFLFRTASPGRDLLRRWWDGSGYDRKHAYEQDALWDILDGAGFRLEPLRDNVCAPARLNKSTVAVVGTRQFLSDASQSVQDHLNESWVLHLGGGRRVPDMRAQLSRRGIDARSFTAAVDDMQQHRLRKVDCLAFALEMHAESCKEARRCNCCRATNWWQ
jgi:hypothetical protein